MPLVVWLGALSAQFLAAKIVASADDTALAVSVMPMKTNPSSTQDGSGGGALPPLSPRAACFLAQIAAVRELLAEGREVFPQHWDVSPRWDLHESRLDEIERLARSGIPGDFERIDALHADFLQSMNADLAASMAGPIKRLARLMDQVVDRQPESKFVIPLEALDCGEDLLTPHELGL